MKTVSSIQNAVDLYPSPPTGVKRCGGWLKERGVQPASQPASPISAKRRYYSYRYLFYRQKK
jgi:hypothetical protein